MKPASSDVQVDRMPLETDRRVQPCRPGRGEAIGQVVRLLLTRASDLRKLEAGMMPWGAV